MMDNRVTNSFSGNFWSALLLIIIMTWFVRRDKPFHLFLRLFFSFNLIPRWNSCWYALALIHTSLHIPDVLEYASMTVHSIHESRISDIYSAFGMHYSDTFSMSVSMSQRRSADPNLAELLTMPDTWCGIWIRFTSCSKYLSWVPTKDHCSLNLI